MLDIQEIPVTHEQARSARAYFGWSQTKAAEESGLRIDKIKRFEAGFGKSGAYVPDFQFLHDLRAFYESRGYHFDDTPTPGAKAKQSGLVFPGGVVGSTADYQGETAGARPVKTSLHHMRIALTNEDEMGHVLDLIEENEGKAEELLRAPVETAFFGGLTDESSSRHAEAIRVLSENGVLFARLFGRDIGGSHSMDALKANKKPDTHAELLHRTHADAHLAVAGDHDAKARHKSQKPAESVFQAIGLA